MERSISIDDRVKRAEEIYSRRHNNSNVNSINKSKNITKRKIILTKWLIIKIIICICIYAIFCMLKSSNGQFSQNLFNKINEYILMDTNFIELSQKATYNIKNSFDKFNNYILSISNKNENVEQVQNTDDSSNDDENKEENTQNTENESQNLESSDGLNGIGGGESEQVVQPITQMEQDAQTIKTNYNLILPVQGIVSSRFGPREATQIVSANHAGIDIAAPTGTSIIASAEGTVTEVSTQGDYRKPYNNKKR